MVYASGGLIEAVDYNNFVASVNAIWGTGTGDSGYGQTPLSGVLQSSTVAAAEWATLISRLDSMDRHQTNTTSGITPPTSNTTITYLSSIGSMISTLTTNRLTTALARTAVSNAVTNGTTWVTSSTMTTRITWTGGAAAMRYFFNAGGNIQFTAANSTLANNSKSLDWDALLTACGTITISAQTSSRTPGSGTPTINPNTVQLGFYDLTTSAQNIMQQFSTTLAGGYNNNYALWQAYLGGSPGSTNTMDILQYLYDGLSPDEALPAGQNDVQGTVRFDVTVNFPSTAYLSNVWGGVTFSTITNSQG